jgi:hypothetical protein
MTEYRTLCEPQLLQKRRLGESRPKTSYQLSDTRRGSLDALQAAKERRRRSGRQATGFGA